MGQYADADLPRLALVLSGTQGSDEPQLDKLELYDLSKDIGEANNVAADNPETARQMLGFLTEAWAQPRRQKGSRIPFNPAGGVKNRPGKQAKHPRQPLSPKLPTLTITAISRYDIGMD